MADILRLSRLVGGISRNLDISTNTLVVQSVKVGGSVSNTELTKAILDTLTSGGDASSLHNHDGRYNTKTQEASAASGSAGSTLVGDDNSYTNFTPATATVKGALSAIDSRFSSVTNEFVDNVFRVKDDLDLTKKIAFQASGLATATTRTITMPNADVDLGKVASALQKDGSVTATGALNMGSNKISGITSGSATGEAVEFSQLANYVPNSAKGANNGVASLDSGGKVPVSQLPNSIMEYLGTYNASTNTPTLVNGTGNTGDVYRVNTAGAGVNSLNFIIGDYVIYNGTTWEKAHSGADAVLTVNGFAGVVVLSTTDIAEGVNLYFTTARAKAAAVANAIVSGVTDVAPSQDAVFSALALKQDVITAGVGITKSGATISAKYDNASIGINGSNELEVKNLGVTNAKLAGSITTSKLVDAVPLAAVIGGGNADAYHSHALLYKSFTNNTGSTLAAGAVVALSLTVSGEVILASNAAIASCESIAGVVVAAILTTASGLIQIAGEATVTTDGTNYDLGKRVYLGAAGVGTKTAPSALNSVVHLLGGATATNKVLLNMKLEAINE